MEWILGFLFLLIVIFCGRDLEVATRVEISLVVLVPMAISRIIWNKLNRRENV